MDFSLCNAESLLTFAYVQHKCVQPMFTKMGIPGGVKRYMDDIIAALLCRNPDNVTAAEAFVSELNNPAVYPPPLCLSMEPQSNQEFLEADLTVAGNQLALSPNSKVTTDSCADCLHIDRGCPTRCSELLTELR